jgi:hypothetical protein
MVFLFALGLVYGIAYACVNNVLVLWPVLIPISWFFNNLQSGSVDLMWAAIVGFCRRNRDHVRRALAGAPSSASSHQPCGDNTTCDDCTSGITSAA